MGLQYYFPIHEAAITMQKNKLLPVKVGADQLAVSCVNCRFVNNYTNNFCTNCGYPQQHKEGMLAIYNTRMQQRNNLKESCSKKIRYARNSLYVIAACCIFCIAFIFENKRKEILTSVILFVLAAMYVSLGKWTTKKPFTSLLISLLLMLTFIAINASEALASASTSAAGIYVFMMQAVLTYFLVQGVKAAFHADVLEEEFKV